MKIKFIQNFILCLFIVGIAGCSKDNSSTPNPYGSNNGQLSFYVVQSSNPRATYPITVVVNGQSIGSTSITYSASAPPNCGPGTGILTYTAPAGSYVFTASGANGSSVTGAVTITSGQCTPETINN